MELLSSCSGFENSVHDSAVFQGHSWLYGSGSPPEGHSIRQQRRLVLLRLHALQTPAGVTTSSSLFFLLLLTIPAMSQRPVCFHCAPASQSIPSLNRSSHHLWSVFDLACVAACVLICSVNARGLEPVGQKSGKMEQDVCV